MSTARFSLFVFGAIAASCPGRSSAAQQSPPPAQSVTVHALDTTEGLQGPGKITLSDDRVQGRHSVEWAVGPGKKHGFLTFHYKGRGIEAAEWEEVRFRYKVLTGGWTWFGVKLVDYPVANGLQAVWRVDGGHGLEPGPWREVVLDLAEPMYHWGEKPDEKSQWFCFRGMADKPAVILLDDVRFARQALRVRILESTGRRESDGTRRCSWTFELTNPTDTPRAVRVSLDRKDLRAFKPTLSAEAVQLAPKQTSRLEVHLVATPAALLKVKPLTSERATVYFVVEAVPAPSVYPVEIEAVTGLPSHAHPILLVRRDEIAAIKKKVARGGWAKKAYDRLLASADRALKKKVELPPRGSQWWHWYSCSKCGTRLKMLGPTRHQCPTCRKVYSGQPYDDVVLSRDHFYFAHAVEDLGLAYQFTRDRRYAVKAAEILERYAKRYLTYKRHDKHGRDRLGGGRVSPQTLDEAVWLISVVRGYDFIWNTLSREQRETIERKLLRPAAELIMEHKIGIHNIQCWKNSAVGLVGICIGEPRFLADAVTSPHGIHKQLAEGILDDGFWYEGAWGYHYYTMSALWPLAEALRHVGIEVYDERYRSFYAAPLLFALPGGRLPAFNDSGESNAYGSWRHYELACARWGDPMFAAMLKGKSRDSRDSLLFGLPDLDVDAELPAGSRNFPVSGYAYLQCYDRHGRSPVAILDYAPHGGGHGHPEKLQLLFWANGEVVAPDPGCIHYGVPLHREWYKQTISHNTVTVDRRSQRPCRGKLLCFHATSELAVASASADDAYDGVRFTRTVVLLSGGLVVDLVELASEGVHTYDWAFHCYGEFTTPLRLDSGSGTPGDQDGYQHIRALRVCVTDEPVVARWTGDKTAVGLTMLPHRNTRLYAGDGHGQPPARKLPTLIVRRRGKTALFVSAFHVGDGSTRSSVLTAAPGPRGKARLVVTAGDQTAAVLVPLVLGKGPKASPESLPPLLNFDTDAQTAVVRLKAGKLQALAFAAGKRVATADGVSISASRKVTVSLTYKPDGRSVMVVDAQGKTNLKLANLFPERSEVTTEDGKRVRATWRRGTLSFSAEPGRYYIGPAVE